jgi:hypothetical protein
MTGITGVTRSVEATGNGAMVSVPAVLPVEANT